MTAFTIIQPAGSDSGQVQAATTTLIAQTFGDFELLVVHDGTTGEPGPPFQLQDPRITSLYPDAGRGLSERLNLALGVAQGEAVIVARTHDRYRKDFLYRLHEALLNADLDVAAIGTTSAGASYPRPDPSDPANWVWRNPLDAAVAVRRRVFDSLGGFTQELTSLMEWDLWIRMLASGYGFHVISEPLVEREPNPQAALKGRALVAEYSLISQRHLHPYLSRIGRTDLLTANIEGFITHPDFQCDDELADLVTARVLAGMQRSDVIAVLRTLGTTLGDLRLVATQTPDQHNAIDRLTQDCQQRADELRQSQFELQAALDRLGSAELDRRIARDELARWQASMVYRAARKAKRGLMR